jgi:hypothetical protein
MDVCRTTHRLLVRTDRLLALLTKFGPILYLTGGGRLT